MKLLATVLFILTVSSFSFSQDSDREPSRIIVLFGTNPADTEKYHRITKKTLDESNFAVLFLRAEGFAEKEIVQKRKEISSLNRSGDIDFDVKVSERFVLILGQKKYALLIENIREEYSKKKLATIEKKEQKGLINKQLPEEPVYIETTLTYYDQFGNILMKEAKKGCGGMSFYSHENPLSQGQLTFALSDNGERFSFCYSCNKQDESSCSVYSPLREDVFNLEIKPLFNRATSFSPNSRYFVYYYSFGKALIFIDLEAKTSAQVSWSRRPGLLQAFDNGTFVVAQSDKKVRFNIHGQEVNVDGGR